MFQRGVMQIGSTAYWIFKVEEKGFSRVDICREDARFHVDIDKVLYSRFSRRESWEHGDAQLYNKYLKILEIANKTRGETTKEDTFKNGAFHSIQTKISENFKQEVTFVNGVERELSIQTIEGALLYETNDGMGVANMNPMNFKEYKKVKAASFQTTASYSTKYIPLNVLQQQYDIGHLQAYDMVVVDTLEEARERLQEYRDSPYPFRGFDTETTGLNFHWGSDEEMVGIVLGHNKNASTYYPFRHKSGVDNLPIEFLKELMDVVVDTQKTTKLIAHHKKFDRQVMLHEGYDIRIDIDTRIKSFMIRPILQRGVHGLKDLEGEFLGLKFLELDEIFPDGDIDFSILPKDIIRAYACPDAFCVFDVYEALDKLQPREMSFIMDIEYKLADVKADQEYYGMRVDVGKYISYRDNARAALQQLDTLFRTLTGCDGKLSSSHVIADLLYNKLKCPILARTGTGQPSTGAAVINKLSSLKRDTPIDTEIADVKDSRGNILVKGSDLAAAKFPALKVLAAYKKLNKEVTAYYNRYDRTMEGDRVFFWINQNGALSGRQSSPQHQLPKNLKACLLSDSLDHNMIDADYAQVELRLFGGLSGEKDLCALCNDPTNDIHRIIANLITGTPIWAITDAMRGKDKARNFGVVYLMSKFGLAGNIHGPGCSKEHIEQAGKSIDAFFDRFLRMRRFIKTNADFVSQNGYIKTKFYRRRIFPTLNDPDISSKERASQLRQANNTPVQGTAADIMKIAEVNIDQHIRLNGWNKLDENGFPLVRVALSIHDEVILMVHKSIPLVPVLKCVRDSMELDIKDLPALYSEPSLINNWLEGKDDEKALPIRLRDKIIAEWERTGECTLTAENWQETIDFYRDNNLKQYLAQIRDEFGPENMAANIRHPQFTHELISRYKVPGTIEEQEERISYAVDRYLESPEAEFQVDSAPEEEEEVYESNAVNIEELVNVDASGEVILDTYVEAAEEDDNYYFYEEEFDLSEKLATTLTHVWKFANNICVDITDFSDELTNAIIAKLFQYKEPEGFYAVSLLRDGQLLDTGFRIESLDIESINIEIEGMLLCA